MKKHAQAQTVPHEWNWGLYCLDLRSYKFHGCPRQMKVSCFFVRVVKHDSTSRVEFNLNIHFTTYRINDHQFFLRGIGFLNLLLNFHEAQPVHCTVGGL